MILVDTNIWSELVKAAPDPNVEAWEAANAEKLWLATIVVGEFLSGVALMSEGKRQDALLTTYELILQTYQDRLLDFDLNAARHYAQVLAFLEKSGRNPTTADAQIAAIALSNDMALATRNAKDFAGLGLELIDPWTI
jgi:toxin FitB